MQPVATLDIWPECAECGEEYDPRRRDLGYLVCMPCGERDAQKGKQQKAKACVVTHKSNVLYLGQGKQALDNLAAISRMRR